MELLGGLQEITPIKRTERSAGHTAGRGHEARLLKRVWRGAQRQHPHGPAGWALGKTPPFCLGSLPSPRLSLVDVEGSCRTQRGLPQWGVQAPPLPGPFKRHRARSKGPSTEDQRQAWKECKQEDIFKLFPALAIRALEARGPEVSPALTKKQS